MIKFGTDGWRAIISEEFTFENVARVAQSIAKYLINHKQANKPVIIGYDARFLADAFARKVAEVLAQNGISGFIMERDTPTPVVAWLVKVKQAAGAVMLTASHNPAYYCGIKFIPDYAGPANEAITKEIETVTNQITLKDIPQSEKKGHFETLDPRDAYLASLDKFINFESIKAAKLKVVLDPMYGSGRGYLDPILVKNGCQVEEIHFHRDVLFGGRNPEPCDELLGELKAKVVENKAALGIANDGDADRFAIIDDRGITLSANQVLPFVAWYLIKVKKSKGALVRSIATSHLLDLVAKKYGMDLVETPVGFKYIAAEMLKRDVVIGGEESGGLSIHGHIPEKDGILAGLLVVEMIAHFKKKLSVIWQEFVAEIGELHNDKINLHLEQAKKDAIMNLFKNNTPKEVAGVGVKEVKTVDGVKLICTDGSWLLVRASGTEPIIRAYFEASSSDRLTSIRKYLNSLV
jgi:alpha-D-glucose phosphate-specific phosphoglucomutase